MTTNFSEYKMSTIKVAGGTNGGETYLSTIPNGTMVDLFDKNTFSGRQMWRFLPVANMQGTFNILVHEAGVDHHGENTRRYLSTNKTGTKVDLWHKDDGSGRQRWKLSRVDGSADAWTITIADGVTGDRKILSCTREGRVDLWKVDDGSERQRWKVSPVRETVDLAAMMTAIGGRQPGSSSLMSDAEKKRLVQECAPLFVMAKREGFAPKSFQDYREHDVRDMSPNSDGCGNLTPWDDKNHHQPEDTRNKTRFSKNVYQSMDALMDGEQVAIFYGRSAPTYAFYQEQENGEVWIRYFLFFGYNAAVTITGGGFLDVGDHFADWVHVSVALKKSAAGNYVPFKYYFAHHAGGQQFAAEHSEVRFATLSVIQKPLVEVIKVFNAGVSTNAGETFLSSNYNGKKVDLYHKQDSSGRQTWIFQQVGGNIYNIINVGGAEGTRKYLSSNGDGRTVDLWHEDDGSGRQRWKVENYGSYFTICVAGGVGGDRRFLSCNREGKVDLWKAEDGSGRQKWTREAANANSSTSLSLNSVPFNPNGPWHVVAYCARDNHEIHHRPGTYTVGWSRDECTVGYVLGSWIAGFGEAEKFLAHAPDTQWKKLSPLYAWDVTNTASQNEPDNEVWAPPAWWTGFMRHVPQQLIPHGNEFLALWTAQRSSFPKNSSDHVRRMIINCGKKPLGGDAASSPPYKILGWANDFEK